MSTIDNKLNVPNNNLYGIDALSEYLGTTYFEPKFKEGYNKLGQKIAQFVGNRYGPECQAKVEAAWVDPVSTNTCLKYSKVIQAVSSKFAAAKPFSNRFLHYPSRVLISLAQKTFSLSKEANTFLALPSQIQQFSEDFSLDNTVICLADASPSFLSSTLRATIFVKNMAFTLLKKICYLIDKALDLLSFGHISPIATSLYNLANAKKENIDRKIGEKILKKTEEIEAEVRQTIVKVAVGKTLPFISFNLAKSSICLALSSTVYILGRTVLQDYLNVSQGGVDLVTIGLGVLGGGYKVGKMLLPYYHDYDPNFDPQKGMGLKDLCKRYDQEKAYLPLQFIQDYFQNVVPKQEDSLLDRLKQKVVTMKDMTLGAMNANLPNLKILVL